LSCVYACDGKIELDVNASLSLRWPTLLRSILLCTGQIFQAYFWQ
jgi:hypothetical protein